MEPQPQNDFSYMDFLNLTEEERGLVVRGMGQAYAEVYELARRRSLGGDYGSWEDVLGKVEKEVSGFSAILSREDL